MILNTQLMGGIEGKEQSPYQARLVPKNGKVLFQVSQNIRGEWFQCGSWYLSTLLERERPHDGLSIDYGQQWSISSGMNAALKESVIYLADHLEGLC